MLRGIENANINIQSKLHVYTFICFRVTPKTKIDLVENRFCVKIPLIFMFFPALLKTIGNIIFRPPQCINNIHFLIKQDTEVENRSIISTTYRVRIYKKNKKKIHIIVK